MLEDTLSDTFSDLADTLSELSRHSLSFERLDGIGVCRGWHDDERNDGCLGTHLLKSVVQAWASKLPYYLLVSKLTG